MASFSYSSFWQKLARCFGGFKPHDPLKPPDPASRKHSRAAKMVATRRISAPLQGEVFALYTSPLSAAPMVTHTSVELIASKGIKGDRYANKQGSYSALKFSAREPGAREPGRQLTIISADSIDLSLNDAGLESATAPGKSYGDFRRNVVVRGISAEALLAAQGGEICLGPECRVFIHRHCVPCTPG